VATLLQGPEHTRQDSLGLGAILAAVGVDVLPYDQGWSDLSLGIVVVRRYAGMIQEREKVRYRAGAAA
jgi:hypothetical protein